MSRAPRVVAAAAIALAGNLAFGSTAAASAWTDLGAYHSEEAIAKFEQAAHAGAGSRTDRLGLAVALLTASVSTEARATRAAGLLELLVAERRDDEPGLTARYLLGRLAQTRHAKANVALAESYFRELVAESPKHVLAQEAAVKLALLALYGPGDASTTERIASAEQWLERIDLPAPRRDLHLALGRALLFFDARKDRALQHFVAALHVGIINEANRATILITIGELARELERPAEAREAYEAFLREHPRDHRRVIVKHRLKELP